jgi:O-antigen/teichoic acid export membrane protein
VARTESAAQGLRAVLLSIVVAGVLGYVIQLSAPALTDDKTYVAFSVFWSTLYLGGSAMAGVQQEISRAARPGDGPPTAGATLRIFTVVLGTILVLAVLGVCVLFGHKLFGDEQVSTGVALGIGLIGYLLSAVLNGILYGLRLWSAVTFSVIVDAVLRAVLVVLGLLMGAPLPVLVLMVAIPFAMAFLLTLAVFRSRITHRVTLDVDLRRLLLHTAGTVVAAASSGLLISGMPMLLGVASGMPAAATAALILAITVTRAPIVVPIIALQSFFISAVFRDRAGVSARRLLTILGLAMAAVAALCVVAWWTGPAIIRLLSGGAYTVGTAMASVIVASAGLVALLSLTGPMLIADRRHGTNAGGWVVAAILTVILLALQLGELGLALTLLLPPLAGLVVHVGALLMPRRARGVDDIAGESRVG